MPPPVDGMPAWLSTLEAEIAGQGEHVPEVHIVSTTPGEPKVRLTEEGGPKDTGQEVSAQDDTARVGADIPETGTRVGAEVEEETATKEGAQLEAVSAETKVPGQGETGPLEPMVATEAADQTETAAETPGRAEQPQEREPPDAEQDSVELETVLEAAKAAGETGTEQPREEVALGSEQDVEPPESAPPTEDVVEPATAETAPSSAAGEDADWVRELEEPLSEEPEAGAEPPAEAEPESPDPWPVPQEPESVPVAAESVEEHLSTARALLADGSLEDASRAYEQLLDIAPLHSQLVADLEQAVEANPGQSTLIRVLGDTYMRAGELQKALGAYRRALHSLQQGA
jgi:hypothetical protein